VAEQLGGGWPSRGQTGAWLKRRAVLAYSLDKNISKLYGIRK